MGRTAVIDTAVFPFYAIKATQLIYQHTFGRIKEPSTEVKMCCCELAEAYFEKEEYEVKGNVSSEKVGEHSISYADAQSSNEVFKEKTNDIINQWLLMSGLLYRGC